jgi:hypothetical protein
MSYVSTIEDCLEILVGLKLDYKFDLNLNDRNILSSIGRQVFRKIPLTDRQFKLVSTKILSYKDNFDKAGIVNFDEAINNLRMPLREIDRSKYITIVDTIDAIDVKDYMLDWQWIKIRFPFSKKDIIKLEEISTGYRKEYQHKRGSHEHYFRLTENTTFSIVEKFKDKTFVIDKKLIEIHDEVYNIKQNVEKHIPCIKDGVLYNINENLIKIINEQTDNLTQVVDRHRRFGVENFNQSPDGSLKNSIAYRTDKSIHIQPSSNTIDELVLSMYELNRFPLIVLLEEANAENQLHQFYNSVKNLISNDEQSILFRQEGQTEFNKFVKTKKLNNWVDRNTKIVYASTNKLPKVLLTADWSPIASISYNSGMNRQLSTFISDRCDLVIYYDEHMSPFRRFSNLYEM